MFLTQCPIRTRAGPNRLPTLPTLMPATCSRNCLRGLHATAVPPPWVTRALHAIHRARPCLHAPCALLPMRSGTSTPSPSPSPLPARSLLRSPRSRAAVRHGRRLKLAAVAFPCLRPPSTQMDRRTTFLSSCHPRCAPSSVLLAVCLLCRWSRHGQRLRCA